ncbi:M23 family metallopeptidase [Streptomyces zhihengii]|uniref:Peptidoglycan DD-metalloendopeptidase family protein n=1 Tax=Streptomyces zhihengii TaxID=1818004 RepID=A0ABS2URX6_9ACTN|nr:M23 family metallopeptidase [Streptomyces zhihengii]MBM9619848.1 peptidoglycan DD-metalloendopeptidase family protein [Streptomyces zhihengii]
MNDQHAHAGYAGYATGSFDSDPLFGTMPGAHEAGHSGQYDASAWDASAPTAGYDAYASAQQPSYDQQYAQYDTTGQWDASAWNQAGETGGYETAAATFAYDTTGQWASPSVDTGAFDATAWNHGTGTPEGLVPQQFAPEQEFAPAPGYDTGAYTEYQEAEYREAEYQHTAYSADAGHLTGTDYGQTTDYAQAQDYGQQTHDLPQHDLPQHGDESAALPDHDHTGYDAARYEDLGHESAYDTAAYDEAAPGGEHPDDEPAGHAHPADDGAVDDEPDQHSALTQTMTAVPVTPRPVRRAGGSRGRRRTPAKRSALLTVAVPSACVMGVAGIAAASVGDIGAVEKKDDTANLAAADPASVKPVAVNNEMDTQLAALSADARDFGDRASRTQERIDLKERQAAEKKKREEEAARREALRPKFSLPVKRTGLSAYYGQSGVNWMSLHSGIDFPVMQGTEVLAATDGTVRTQWNGAYGNMVIVTAADGTETWYCHLSSAKIRSGSVKAGDVIAYSGDTGNSTGPHLHFEVRPGGGAAIDPLAWLRSHGLDPT